MRDDPAVGARVLLVTHSAVPAGAELKMLNAAHHLPNSEIFFLEDGPLVASAAEVGIPVSVVPAPDAMRQVRTGSRALAGVRAVPGAARMCWQLATRYRRFDVVVAFSQKAFVLSAPACILARRPLVWMLNDILTARHFSPAMRTLALRLSTVAAAKVVCNSVATAEAFASVGGNVGRSVVLHPGVDIGPYLSADAAPRAALGVPPDAFVVGLFGRLAPWKGQDVLVQALARLPDQVHAVIVGGSPFGEDAYREQLASLARERGVDARTHFLGHRSDIPALMCACDVIVHTSIEPEPFGRVIVEGMISGRPLVAALAGGVPEIITHGDTGILVPPSDVEALATEIERLRCDPGFAARIAAAGREHACATFSASAMAAGLRSVFEAVQPRQVAFRDAPPHPGVATVPPRSAAVR